MLDLQQLVSNCPLELVKDWSVFYSSSDCGSSVLVVYEAHRIRRSEGVNSYEERDKSQI